MAENGTSSPVDSLDDEHSPKHNGVIKVENSHLLSQLTSNSPLPAYKTADAYRLAYSVWKKDCQKFLLVNSILMYF